MFAGKLTEFNLAQAKNAEFPIEVKFEPLAAKDVNSFAL